MGKSEEKVPKGWLHTQTFINDKVSLNKLEVITKGVCPAKEVVFRGETFILSHFVLLIKQGGETFGARAVYYTEPTKIHGHRPKEKYRQYIESLNEGDTLDFSKLSDQCTVQFD